MIIIEPNKYFDDRMYPGAFIGATLIASGIKNSAIIFHGYLGCNIESVHMRSDSIPGGFYTPIIATGLNESDSIYGGNDKLKATLEMVLSKKYELVWIITGDATSIIADDIHSIVNTVNNPYNAKIISLDVPGFLGGIAKGTDIAASKLLDLSQINEHKSKSVCLVAPHLMGIKSHPSDINELKSMLKRSGVSNINVLSNNLNIEELKILTKNETIIPLTWEELTELKSNCIKNNLNYYDKTLPLPIGIANTEQWLIKITDDINVAEKAKQILIEDKEIITKQLKYNYNYSWLSTLYTEKTCSIYGNAIFAVSLAMCFYYDLNIKPKVIAVLAETEQAKSKTINMLEELAKYLDFELLINPDYYTYINHVKKHNVDFAVGSIQDKPLCVGENIPHMSLAGYYFFNNFNFTPWPYMGIKGMLSILTELGHQMEKTFYYEKYWKNYSYKPTQ